MAKVSNTSNPLINVTFTDATNNVAPIDTMDIVGVVVDTCWGPSDVFRVLDRAAWRAFANPLKMGVINHSYATVERVFDAGAQYIEVYRPAGVSNYRTWAITPPTEATGDEEATAAGITYQVLEAAALTTEQAKVGTDYLAFISMRYPGGFDCTLRLSPLTGRLPEENAKLNVLDFIVNGTVVESHTISFHRYVVNGQSFFYADVLNSNSQYLTAFDNYEGEAFALATTDDSIEAEATNVDPNDKTKIAYTALNPADYATYYGKFQDRTQSQATLLIPTLPADNSEADDQGTAHYTQACNAIVNAVNKRMDICGLTGVPRSVFNADSTKAVDQIQEFVSSISTTSVMFWGAIAAWETYTVNNTTFSLDGTASWAGAICAVANQVSNRNQLPSYIAYGRTNAVLTQTLEFESVVNLMDTYGIGSIYSSATGNYIFNIRSQYFPQSSYFGKLNVGRITASILHWLLPAVEGVIHTEVTSDAVQRLQFQDQCNGQLEQMIARGELKAESYIDIGNEINTDALTNGGECLNIEVHAWYKKLTEEVRISIIATDTTTTVSVSEGE